MAKRKNGTISFLVHGIDATVKALFKSTCARLRVPMNRKIEELMRGEVRRQSMLEEIGKNKERK